MHPRIDIQRRVAPLTARSHVTLSAGPRAPSSGAGSRVMYKRRRLTVGEARSERVRRDNRRGARL